MTKTYTIAMIGDWLAATAIDGDSAALEAQVQDTMSQLNAEDEKPAVRYETGLTLYESADDAEDDGAELAYSGNDQGWLIDENGKTWGAAARKEGGA